MWKTDVKIAFLLSIICFIAGFFVLPYQLETLQTTIPQQYDVFMETLPFSLKLLTLLSALQLWLISWVLAFLGLRLARRTGFSFSILASIFTHDKGKYRKKDVALSVFLGLLVAFIIVAADKFYFQHVVAVLGENEPAFSWLGLITGVLYGGVFEEILLRLFFMSLFVWTFAKLFFRNNDQIPAVVYIVAILISSVLFAAGHLPASGQHRLSSVRLY
ncbi:type II CAAX prenyl endopeptidase Rce1 family protein [Bacillus piscicola]|uniref:CPBP family glutamic-type intramembrane protease n=1 Tax=Bacillus piscicola TaxID=1632684 RepID=UPI001F0907AD|nr:CPBP family glutamic-type intramembrane protease [Bacillus piscicola]